MGKEARGGGEQKNSVAYSPIKANGLPLHTLAYMKTLHLCGGCSGMKHNTCFLKLFYFNMFAILPHNEDLGVSYNLKKKNIPKKVTV